MEWRKLKNVVLIILIALNLMLAVLIGGPRLGSAYQQAQGRANAVAFLEGKGIHLANVTVPDPLELLPMVVERDMEAENRLAGQLLGEEVRRESQGGDVYRYTSPLGTVQFHSDGSFWARLEPTAFPIENDPEAALRVLRKLDFEGTVTAQYDRQATFRQSREEAALFFTQATVVWDEAGITEIAGGRRLYGTPQDDPTRAVVDQPTALIDFYNGLNRLGDVCSRVDLITPGYTATVSLNKLTMLNPVWRVTTDTGVYQLDLVTGELARVS